ncbi:DUF222 domain-containing protein, partial [Arthrobacter sp. TMN-50]
MDGSADTAADGSAEPSVGASGGYGPGGPLGVDAVWTASVGAPSDAPSESPTGFGARVGSGGGLAGLSGRVVLTAVAGLDVEQTLGVLRGLGGLRSWVDAQEAKAVTHVNDLTATEYPGLDDPGRVRALAAAEIGAATRVPEVTTGILIDHSELLVRDFPTTLTALEDGRLSKSHAWAVVGEAISIPDTVPAVRAVFESTLIMMAAKTTVRKFCGQAQRLREKLHPESITIRHRKAVLDRRVYLDPAPDGMAWFQAFLPVEQAAGIFHRVDTAARNLQGPDEPRTLTQLRADVLVDVLTSAGTTGHMTDRHMTDGHMTDGHLTDGHLTDGPEPAGDTGSESASGSDGDAGTGAGKNAGHDSSGGNGSNDGNGGNGGNGEPVQSRDSDAYWGVQAKVFVTVPVLTLLGGDTPGELEGYGPIDPETARKLAGHASS